MKYDWFSLVQSHIGIVISYSCIISEIRTEGCNQNVYKAVRVQSNAEWNADYSSVTQTR